jgi:outer membrane protein OmpA-like peptidoglycan-associated protein
MKKTAIVLMIIAIAFTSFGCSSMTRGEQGAVIGGGAGAAIGAVIGKQLGNTAAGAIIGGAVGGIAGGIIGNYMDEQAAEIERDLEGAKVERVGEGIKITFDSGILFDVNKAELRPAAQENLRNLAVILMKYEDTDILIEGHTDAQGAENYNQTLSERRSGSVAHYLVEQAVGGSRMSTIGYGELQPISDNETAAGRQENRRVEIAIMANDKLKKAARDQAAQG